ncbi:mitogen-activated protein kinase kinase kinase 3 isoform X2 [Hydra vulgaris]|uniref:mitogen-activated protein kinase kinase kinase 3 isoform X2 n=1 Tax=Hydra vulgaris TaxID=6087 RepID=UPI001F5FBFD0|nr:mitogen-activated protein kinase kinase kinase 3 isoform X3 [Hydra vulgaris]
MSNKTVDLSQEPRKDFKKENQQPDLNGSKQESTVVDKKSIQEKQPPISNSDGQKSTVEDKISIQENQQPDLNGSEQESTVVDKKVIQDKQQPISNSDSQKSTVEDKISIQENQFSLSRDNGVFHSDVKDMLNMDAINIKSIDYNNLIKNGVFAECAFGKGSLHDKISNDGALDEKTASKMSYQILDGLSYLHSKKIIHRDLKCANILLDLNGNCKIADFGISKKIETIRSQTGCNTYTGTYHWMAPEVLRQVKYGNKADIWSFGCTVFAMLLKNLPWSHLEGVIAAIEIATNPTIPDLPDNLSKSCKIFITDCFNSDPAFRPSALTLLTYDWIKIYSS